MKEEKIGGGKVFTFFDWVWRLMVLNVLVIVTSLGVITICPAVCAAFKTIKDTKEKYTPQIFRPFFFNFRYLFRDTFVFSIILVLIIGIGGYGYLWYDGVVGSTTGSGEGLDKAWFAIGMVSIVLLVVGGIIVLMTFIQLPMVLTYFPYGFSDNVRLCFFMAFKHFMTSILETAIGIVSIVLLINGLFIYSLLPMWLFFGISLPLYLDYILSRRIYKVTSDNLDDDADEYDYQGKKVNRETYEDDKKTIKEDEDNKND